MWLLDFHSNILDKNLKYLEENKNETLENYEFVTELKAIQIENAHVTELIYKNFDYLTNEDIKMNLGKLLKVQKLLPNYIEV